MQVHEIKHNSSEYRQAVELRDNLLRIPLGLDIYEEDLEAERNEWHFGLFDDAHLVGCAVAVPKSPTHAKVRQMAIDAERQGQGCGRILLTAVEQALASRGVQTLELAARSAVVDFYVKLGYHSVGEEFVEVGIPHIAMHKHL